MRDTVPANKQLTTRTFDGTDNFYKSSMCGVRWALKCLFLLIADLILWGKIRGQHVKVP